MVTPESRDNQSPTAFLHAIENGTRGVISEDSKKYCLELSETTRQNVRKNKLLYRFYTENPSIQSVPTTDVTINFMRRWMNLPTDFNGDTARAALRLEIRRHFPLLALHYVQYIAEADICINSIQGVSNPDLRKLTFYVQYAFASLRWLDDPTSPQIPPTTVFDSASAMAAILTIRRWLQGKLEAATFPMAKQSTDSRLMVGNWLMPPLALKELSERLGGIANDKLHTLLDQYGLCNFPVDNRQSWTLCLDPPMPPSLRKKIESGSRK